MLTLKVIRENRDEVVQKLAKKNFDSKKVIHVIIELDDKRRN